MQVYGASLKDPGNACLVMELVRGGNLHQRIYDRNLPKLTHMQILQVRIAMRRTQIWIVRYMSCFILGHLCLQDKSLHGVHLCSLLISALARLGH